MINIYSLSKLYLYKNYTSEYNYLKVHSPSPCYGLVFLIGVCIFIWDDLSNKVCGRNGFRCWEREAGGATGLDGVEEPCHVFSQSSHNLDALHILQYFLWLAAVDHIPILACCNHHFFESDVLI